MDNNTEKNNELPDSVNNDHEILPRKCVLLRFERPDQGQWAEFDWVNGRLTFTGNMPVDASAQLFIDYILRNCTEEFFRQMIGYKGPSSFSEKIRRWFNG